MKRVSSLILLVTFFISATTVSSLPGLGSNSNSRSRSGSYGKSGSRSGSNGKSSGKPKSPQSRSSSSEIEDIIITDESDSTSLYMTLEINDPNVAMADPDDCESQYITYLEDILSNLLYVSNENVMAICVREAEPQYSSVNEIIVTITFDYSTQLNNVLSMITDNYDLEEEIKYDLRESTGNSDIYVKITEIDARNIDQLYALCTLQAGTGYDGVSGSVEFIENSQNGITTVNYDISGLEPGLHGFHVHESGDLREGCSSTGGHYNPFGFDHSSPDSLYRHVGDLGNIEADSNGNAIGTISDQLLSLVGNNNIAGRGVVVHAGEDDLGLGGDDGSLTTGNAGGRVACCIIGVIAT